MKTKFLKGQVSEWVWILQARPENGCENYIFWSPIWSAFGEPGGTPPPRIPEITHPLPSRVEAQETKDTNFQFLFFF